MMDDIENAFVGIDLILETTSGSKPLNLTMWKPIFTEDTFEVSAGSKAEEYLLTLSCWGKPKARDYLFPVDADVDEQGLGDQVQVTMEFGKYGQPSFEISNGTLTIDEINQDQNSLYLVGRFDFTVLDAHKSITVSCWEFTIGDRA
ncbi:hypothetical protein [Pseudomonas wadenswilerensis]|uniref:hypothetical protein n=1 Tax=Pseudomonas wadenswilerensis TaxID=1785161 RepID=UPI00216038CC|nr:hypothetical protein [Pseudomonas wadenswilerensis]UVM24122.1 hypothetical protein LOY45_11370 [Pseudomonas wadenswilerensis]